MTGKMVLRILQRYSVLKIWCISLVISMIIFSFGQFIIDMTKRSSLVLTDQHGDIDNLFPLQSDTFHVQTTMLPSGFQKVCKTKNERLLRVAVGMGITTRKRNKVEVANLTAFNDEERIQNIELFTTLLPSFCKTASLGFQYNIYIVYDYDDPLLGNHSSTGKGKFVKTFHQIIDTHCQPCLKKEINLYHFQCDYSGKPAWSQNDAMLKAYKDGNDFFYRVNDDTIMVTSQWTEAFIGALYSFDPPYVGVVGPVHRGGNIAILTYDFVHRTHIDIFKFYYPRSLINIYADGWITNVYKPNRTMKVRGTRVRHIIGKGSRYAHEEKMKRAVFKKKEIRKGKILIDEWLSSHAHEQKLKFSKPMIDIPKNVIPKIPLKKNKNRKKVMKN